MQLQQMYQEIILDHYKNPHGRGLREPFTPSPSRSIRPAGTRSRCGSRWRAQGRAPPSSDVSYDGQGCSISQASTSVLTELVVGRTVGQALTTMDAFVELMQGRGQIEPDEEVLEDGVAFAGVAKYPAQGQVRAAWLDGLQGRSRARRGS